MLFIILFGIVSLFSDMTHEGASSIRGAYLSLLGASAATIGFISGLGELVGYSMRYVFGKLTDKSCDDETVEKIQILLYLAEREKATREREKAGVSRKNRPVG